MLALTFSSAAAAEMRERLESLIEVPYEELHVGTFHSFCSRLLADEALEAGLDPFFTAVTPADRLALLLDRQGELTLRKHEIRGNPAPLLASFVSRIDRLKDEMVSCEAFRDYAERLVERCAGEDDAARAHAARELEFAGVYADHDRLLAEQGALDFGDLIARAYALLHEHPHVRRRVAERFKHVLVDEYQDTNFAQGMLLGLLAEEHRNITVVGDDDQAIYRFRGASRKNLEAFEREFPEAETVKLERNYRSGQRILDAARAVVEPTERLEKKLKGKAGGDVRFWRCQSERAQAQAVAVEAERLVTGEGVSPDRVAVLVRSVRHEGATVGAALEERALPFRLSGSAAYFQRAEVRDVLAWLRLLADPTDSGAVVRALSRPPIELRSVDVARLTQLARRRKLDMPSAVAAGLEGPQLSPEGRERATAFLKLYRSASNAFEDRRPDAFVMRLIERIGLRRQQVFARRADTAERLRNIAKLPELATAYMRREPGATPREFTRYLDAVAESGLREEEAPDPDRRARGAGDDHARRQGARVRPRVRARPERRADARAVAQALGRRARRAGARDRALGRGPQGPRGRDAPPAARGDDPRAREPGALVRRARRRDRARVAVRRRGPRGAGGRGGGDGGGAVRPGRGPALDLPPDARRAAGHGGRGGRAAGRAAAGHLHGRGRRRGPLPRAAQGRGAHLPRARGPGGGRGAAGDQRGARPGRHARDPGAAGHLRPRRVAARRRRETWTAAPWPPARAPSPRSTPSSPGGARG